MIKNFNQFNEKIVLKVKRNLGNDMLGDIDVNDDNYHNLAKSLGMKYIGEDEPTDMNIFEVEDDKAQETIDKLNSLDFIDQVEVFDEKQRFLWKTNEDIKDLLDILEGEVGYLDFESANRIETYNATIVEIEKKVEFLKNLYK